MKIKSVGGGKSGFLHVYARINCAAAVTQLLLRHNTIVLKKPELQPVQNKNKNKRGK